jgi:serine protease
MITGAGAQAAVPGAQRSGTWGQPVTNPFSPAYQHPYRHGVVPTLSRWREMKQWAHTHRVLKLNSANNMTYHGGIDGIGVTTGHEKVYLLFYGSQWGTQGTNSKGDVTFSGDPSGEAPYLQEFLKGLGTNNETWSGTATQYCDGVATGSQTCPVSNTAHVAYPSGGALAGVWVDESTAAPAQATGHQLAAEAVTAAAIFGNTTAVSNRDAQYVILSPHGTDPDGWLTGGFCAWHDYNGDSTLSGGPVTSPYGDIAFTNMPYVTDVGTSCGENFVNAGSSGALDGVSIIGGHEYTETITDQNPPGGWYATNTAGENGDKCIWRPPGTPGGSADLSVATGTFAVQSTWANDANGGAGGCDISHPIVTDPPPAQSSNVSPSFHPNGNQANVFYVGANGQIDNWYFNVSTWANGPIGTGEAAEAGSKVAGVWQPNGTRMNVFYTGANGQIYNWYWTGTTWLNGPIGTGEAAAQGTGVAGLWQPNGTRMNVFYVGASGQIYNWYWTGTTWLNGPIGSGEAAAPGTGLTAAWQPNGTAVNVFYTGANGQIYSWGYHGGTWTNSALGTGEAAEPGTGLAAAWQPNGTRANVFYTGANGQIYNWYWTGTTWANGALGSGEAAEFGTGVSATWNPNGTGVDVFYVGANGQVYTWFWNGHTWANNELGTGEAAQSGTGVPVVFHPNATVYYTGANGQIYTWYWNNRFPVGWVNSQL